ncbi:MAG TPA: imidazole glycerol phosphate synthase subunit HisH [Rhodanobacteraceae bacterium]
MDVVLVDAGGTNIGSVSYALERLGVHAPMTRDAGRIRAASHVILPGVGAAAHGMQRLRDSGLDKVITGLAQPVLGVCLGMQLLFEHSAEGDVDCLGLLPGQVQRLHGGPGLRVPHMGWNQLTVEHADPLLDGIKAGDCAYFVHSYAAPAGDATLASCTHGERFSAVVRRGNFCGMQFHPERSAGVGARLLQNFLALTLDPVACASSETMGDSKGGSL